MIKMILGPMRSGKSLMLLREAEKLHYAKRKYIILRNPNDNREFVSRSFKPSISLNIVVYSYGMDLSKFDYILLDEFHLFKTDIIPILVDLSLKGKTIITSGLLSGSDYFDRPCDLMTLRQNVEFLPFANEIIKLNSICENCGSTEGNIEHTKSRTITIGDNYKILCLKCAKESGIFSKYLSNLEN